MGPCCIRSCLRLGFPGQWRGRKGLLGRPDRSTFRGNAGRCRSFRIYRRLGKVRRLSFSCPNSFACFPAYIPGGRRFPFCSFNSCGGRICFSLVCRGPGRVGKGDILSCAYRLIGHGDDDGSSFFGKGRSFSFRQIRAGYGRLRNVGGVYIRIFLQGSLSLQDVCKILHEGGSPFFRHRIRREERIDILRHIFDR